ncbi:hypothetical protein [Streptomyces cavernicola]|uniref:Uncharacterized protein n=1 Tax=Streptomyces cavernicola TaxID=3043613 RepID=A0ABT6SMN4_9ACTN|nr:hypothetical protein [Streptomyces sp. B-S-A6]MDI3409450.1 hypothetical protein [Streptomyces sp. B-S-A6]
MTDDAQQGTEQQDDQNLWRAMYTAEHGWSPGVAFADHLSIAAPALAEVDGTLYCAHRGARQGGRKQLPLRWTSFTPSSVRPFVAALEKASAPLPEDATAEQQAKRQQDVEAAADALAQARKWAPDAYADFIHTSETPALVNDHGTLRMVFTQLGTYGYYDDEDGNRSSLWETHLELSDGEARWAEPTEIPTWGQMALAPGLAVFNGAVHLVYVDLHNQYVQHLVRGAEGQWEPAVTPDALAAYEQASTAAIQALADNDDRAPLDALPDPPLPYRGETLDWLIQDAIDKHGWPGNAALAVHDGALHLLLRADPGPNFLAEDGETELQGGDLLHAVFDGTTWTYAPEASSQADPQPLVSRRGAALATYDGKLHAVFPAVEGDKLLHTTWTRNEGWTSPAKLEGHDSNNTPALLPYKEGPAGAEREALLLVHRGVDRYVPPTPPVPPLPPSIEDVASRGKTVTGTTVTDHANGAWSRLRHDISLTPATLKNGKSALIATWDAVAEYYWGFGWYRDKGTRFSTVRVDRGTLWIRKPGALGLHSYADFGGGEFSNGHFRVDVLITDLEPGTYEIELSSSNTQKTGGYWWDEHLFNGRTDREYWTAITPSSSHATITI